MTDNKSCLNKVKSSKPFEFWDILVYSSILAMIALMFIAVFVFAPKKQDAFGFKIIVNEITIAEYSFSDATIKITDNYADKVIFDQENGVIKVFTNDDKTEFNIISFSLTAKKVWVSESNCSQSKDCTRFEPIMTEGQAIYCLPHNLKILSTGGMVENKPTTGLGIYPPEAQGVSYEK